MASIEINSLPALNTASLSDIFEVYVLSNDFPVSYTISFSDLSGYFFTPSTFETLSAKYVDLKKLLVNFRNFVNEKYPKKTELSNILTTADYLSSIINELMTINKVKKDYLNEYCTYQFADYKKNELTKYAEKLATNLGRERATILNKFELLDTLSGPDDE